ncbi:MAG: sulfur transferase domain-containing protein [Gemmatimonadota bacterium]
MSLLTAPPGLANASSPLPWLIVSGQPTEAQLTALQAAGVRTVIDLRDPMEPRPFNEPAAAGALGMTYLNTPVVSGSLDDAAMTRVLGALRSAKGTPTLMHCASANRTGGPLLAFLMAEEKLAEGDAVNAAMRSGLRSAELLEWATDYVRRNG